MSKGCCGRSTACSNVPDGWTSPVKVDATRALRLAAQRQDGQVTDLDTADAGTVVWEVDFRQPDGTTKVVAIHARTGKILNFSGD